MPVDTADLGISLGTGTDVVSEAYDLTLAAALPLTAAGLVNPLIAGAGMALSSLFVVSNSLRLRRFRSVSLAPPRP